MRWCSPDYGACVQQLRSSVASASVACAGIRAAELAGHRLWVARPTDVSERDLRFPISGCDASLRFDDRWPLTLPHFSFVVRITHSVCGDPRARTAIGCRMYVESADIPARRRHYARSGLCTCAARCIKRKCEWQFGLLHPQVESNGDSPAPGSLSEPDVLDLWFGGSADMSYWMILGWICGSHLVRVCDC